MSLLTQVYNPKNGTTSVAKGGSNSGGGSGKNKSAPKANSNDFPKITKMLQDIYKQRQQQYASQIGHGPDAGDLEKEASKIGRLGRGAKNAGSTIKSLMAYLGSQGIDRKTAVPILKDYLKQEQSLQSFLPKNYVAPGKVGLLNTVLANAPAQQQVQQQKQTQDLFTQYAELQKQQALQEADTYQQAMYDKVMRIKDPDRQAAAAAAVDNAANIMRFSATQDAYGQFTPGGNIAAILGQANQGQNTILNRLYTPSYAGTGATTQGNDFGSMVASGLDPAGQAMDAGYQPQYNQYG